MGSGYVPTLLCTQHQPWGAVSEDPRPATSPAVLSSGYGNKIVLLVLALSNYHIKIC